MKPAAKNRLAWAQSLLLPLSAAYAAEAAVAAGHAFTSPIWYEPPATAVAAQ
jgi:hypothetical protein